MKSIAKGTASKDPTGDEQTNCKWCLNYNGALKNLVKHVTKEHPQVKTTGYTRTHHVSKSGQIEPEAMPAAPVVEKEEEKEEVEVKSEPLQPMSEYVKLLMEDDKFLGPHDDTAIFCQLSELLDKILITTDYEWFKSEDAKKENSDARKLVESAPSRFDSLKA